MANAVVTFNNLVDVVPRDENYNLDISISKPDSVTKTDLITYTANEVTGYGDYNVEAVIEIEKTKWESITSLAIDATNFSITGLRKVYFRYRVFIEETSNTLKNLTDYVNQAVNDTSIVITDALFKTWNPYTVKVEVQQDNDITVYGTKQITVYNTEPYVSIFTVVDNIISLKITDGEMDDVSFRLKLNDQIAFPPSGEFTNLYDSPFNFNMRVPKNLLVIGQENTLTVESQDSLGKALTPVNVSFTGEAQAILFFDLNGNAYTDETGKINKLIDLGIFTSGNTSPITHIKIKNKIGFDIKQLSITMASDTYIKSDNTIQTLPPGSSSIPELTQIVFGKTEAELADNGGLNQLYFGEIFKNGDERDIYFKVTSELLAMGKGSFRINAKAIPV